MMSLRSPLGRVLGRGSARDGVSHWWIQRVTAVALIPLSLWLLISLLTLPLADHASIVAWMNEGLTATLLILFVAVATWHSQLGVQVVVEDYVHGSGRKVATLMLVSFAHVLIAAAGIFAVLKVAFGGVQ